MKKALYQLDEWSKQVEQILDSFTGDPAQVATRSPLAVPYMIEHHLVGPDEPATPLGRWSALRRVLLEAAVAMDEQPNERRVHTERLKTNLLSGKAGSYTRYLDDLKAQLTQGSLHQRLLYWTYLYVPRPSATKIASLLVAEDEAPLPQSSYYRHRNQAINRLAAALEAQLTPALRVESPPAPRPLVGRDAEITACVQALRAGFAVALSGIGGIGKTAVGSLVAGQLAPQPVFWFTLRPGLNDYLRSVLFALSRFLHHVGSGVAWRELLVNQSIVNTEKLLGLIRYELEHLPAPRPVLCFDELDLLRPAGPDGEPEHAQIVQFLASLNGVVPLLLIGQHLPLPFAVQHQPLHGLDRDMSCAVLHQAGVQLSDTHCDRLFAYTGGNPRLLEIFAILHHQRYHTTESVDTLINAMASTPSLESLLNRVWERLESGERDLLTALAVFRRPVPAEHWPRQDLDQLIARHLVQQDGQGGVGILPAFRAAIEQLIPAAQKIVLHQQAALLRAQLGEFTAAAYHSVQAGQPQEAVTLWRRYQTHEISQGQGAAALTIFRDLPIAQVSGSAQEELVLLRSELLKLIGDYPGAVQTLHLISWQTPLLKASKDGLEGDLYDLHDAGDLALNAYEEGLTTIQALLTKELAWLYKRRSRVYLRQRKFDQAWQETLYARYELEDMQGQIQEDLYHFAEAEAYYRRALSLAETCTYTQGQAKTHLNLLRLLALRGRFADARHHAQQALDLARRLGHRAYQASILVNQALADNLADDPQQAIQHANEALAVFESCQEGWGISVAAQNLAEAYLALGDLDQAEHFAEWSVHQEETVTLPDSVRTLGEIAFARGQFQRAEQNIQQSLDIAVENQDLLLEAWAWRALGRVYQAQPEKAAGASAAFERALALFHSIDLPHQAAATRTWMTGPA